MPNVKLSEIDPNADVVSFYGYAVLSTILEPEPIVVVEDSSSGRSFCNTIAVTAVEVGEKTSWQPTQDKAV